MSSSAHYIIFEQTHPIRTFQKSGTLSISGVDVECMLSWLLSISSVCVVGIERYQWESSLIRSGLDHVFSARLFYRPLLLKQQPLTRETTEKKFKAWSNTQACWIISDTNTHTRTHHIQCFHKERMFEHCNINVYFCLWLGLEPVLIIYVSVFRVFPFFSVLQSSGLSYI